GGLAALNYRGIRPGALTSDVFSGAKLIPILLFVGLGLLFVDWHRLALPAPAGKSTVEALKLGGFAALFACTGFEYVPVAAGETENPRRNIPLALIFALLGSMLLYVLVQIVFMGTHPDPGAADAVFADFDRLADLNNAAVFAQYVPTCLAVPMLRRTKGASAFHLPLGPTIPVLATLGCILFLNGIKRADAVFSVATLAVGL